MKRKFRPVRPVPEEIESFLSQGDFDSIEEHWLARVEKDPKDMEFFLAAAQAVENAGAESNARFLSELLDEQLVEAEAWAERLELLREMGHLYVKPAVLHKTILKTLQGLLGHLPSFEPMAEMVGLHRAVEDIPKIWKKLDRLRSLLDFDVGSIVRMEGKGAGKVAEVNMALQSFKVEFDSKMSLMVGFGGAAKLLQPLETDHILYRKMENPEVLKGLRDANPGELLRLVLTSYDKPRTGAEVKLDLKGVVTESGWNRFWTAARKHPQVLTAPGNKRAYLWAESSEAAEDAVWEAFAAADARKQMELLRRDGERDAELRKRMAETLARKAEEVAVSDSGLASEIWFELDRAGEAPKSAEWAPRVLIKVSETPVNLFSNIKDRVFRERSYEMAQSVRDDWADLFSELLLVEQDARSLDFLMEALLEDGEQRFESFFDQLVSNPRKSPAAFTWLVERAADRPEWLGRNPIRLLKQFLFAYGSDEFSPYRASRLVPLVESGGTMPRILSHLDEDQAVQAQDALERTANIEDYQREPLLNALLLRFPQLRKDEEAPLYATADMIAAKEEELKKLAEEEIPANRRAIEEAREMGDLRENFEYKSARQRHEYLSARASALDADLRRVRPIDSSVVKGDEVVIGSRVRLVAPEGERVITILGPWNSLPEEDVLSNESEMAQSLLGLKLGASIDLAERNYKIEGIEPYDA